MVQEATDMLTLAQVESEMGIPVRMLRWYIKTGKMWAELRIDEFGLPYYVTARMEAERAKRLYHPHSRPQE